MKTVYQKLMEGGNVFKDANKVPVTTRIPKESIAASLSMVEEILGFKLDQWLGTTGKKATSGDIDVSVDSSKHDKKEVANKLRAWAKANGQVPGEWVKLSGDNVHFKTPIRNERGEIIHKELKPEYAQLDLMFGDPKFQAWSMRGEPGEFKGMHRHVIMASIAAANGMKWSYKNGLMNRSTNEIISQDPKTIVRKLLPGYSGNPDDLSVESILEYVYKKYKGQPDKIEALIGQAASTLAEHYGVQLPMPEQTAVHESNSTDEYFLAKLRNRIVDLDMEPLIEKQTVYKKYVAEGKLRDMNHLEDLVLDEGPSGLYKAIKILRAFAEGSAQSETTIKWDGSPAIVFGRDSNGRFMLTDKSGFAAKGYDGKSTSAKGLQQMLANRSPSMDQSRQQFITNMGDIFDEYEKATPKDFRGFLSGDVMYFNTPGLEDHTGYVFQPNVVRYEVSKDSELGKKIGQSKSGITIHKYLGDQFNTTEEAIGQLQGTEVLAIPPVYVPHASEINTKPIDKLESFAKQHQSEIAELFNPEGLKGIANIHQLFYKYINNSVDTGLENLGKDFSQWLNTEKLTDSKRANIAAYLTANKKGVSALWTLIRGVMKLKDYLVQEFDSHPADVQQSIGGQKGGEGYVVKTADGPVKLVSRHKFTAANRALHR